jgi:hypothetical protein
VKPLALIPAYTHINWRLLDALRIAEMPYMHMHGCSDLVRARSQLLANGLETDADRFLLIDSDMVPTAEQILGLAQSEKVNRSDAVSGCYVTTLEATAVQLLDPVGFEIDGHPRFIAMRGAGLGFAAIHRSTVEALRDKLPKLIFERDHVWHAYFLPFISEDADGNRYYAEDYAFWWRLHHLAGAKLWLDTHLPIRHLQTVPLLPSGRIEPGRAPDILS